MPSLSTPLLLLLALTTPLLSTAHLSIKHPAPIGLSRLGGPEKYAAPLKADGSDFPCKRAFKIGTPDGLDDSAATWRAGHPATFTLEPRGAAAHWGGSCQASLSYDYGRTWRVLRSFHGGCPRGARENDIPKGADQTFEFVVPADAPGGQAVFAWTYFTVTGFREMYMNCAHVTIEPGPEARKREEGLDPRRHPEMFVGEINECKTREWFNLEFPQPGPEPVVDAGTPFQLSRPEGKC